MSGNIKQGKERLVQRELAQGMQVPGKQTQRPVNLEDTAGQLNWNNETHLDHIVSLQIVRHLSLA